MWNRVKTLIIKELIALWRDKRSRIAIILPPLIQLFIFSFAASLEVKNISIAIFNKDMGKAAVELTHRFEGSPNFTKIYHIEKESQIKELIDTQKVILVMTINSDFSRKIDRNEPADVQLIMDGRRSNSAQIVMGYASSIIDQYNLDRNTYVVANQPPIKLVPRNWFNINLDYIRYTVPCLIGLLSTVIGITVSALSVAREREFGTFDQLLVSPLTSGEILLGKTISALIIGILESSFILAAAIFLFKIPFEGSIIYLYVSLFVFLLSVIGIGLFISSLSMTQQQAILGAFVFIAPATLLSGYATPIENMPVWLQQITFMIPLRHFLVIIKGVFLKAMPLGMVLNSIWPMIMISAFTMTAAGLLFRKRLE
ncbi:MAG: ABC transporter permease [Candidatus Gastranaerophilaceae bacterium]|jgi:ABC-2 type transport system permease protein